MFAGFNQSVSCHAPLPSDSYHNTFCNYQHRRNRRHHRRHRRQRHSCIKRHHRHCGHRHGIAEPEVV